MASADLCTLSLHDALPISLLCTSRGARRAPHSTHAYSLQLRFTSRSHGPAITACVLQDRKSTRLNSSHSQTSYAVFCLKKKKNLPNPDPQRRPLLLTFPPS